MYNVGMRKIYGTFCKGWLRRRLLLHAEAGDGMVKGAGSVSIRKQTGQPPKVNAIVFLWSDLGGPGPDRAPGSIPMTPGACAPSCPADALGDF